MSFSSGVFTINSAGQPVVAGTTITSTAFNAFTADIATGLSTCVLKDGTQTIAANIPMAGFKFTGLGAGSATGNSLRYEQLFSTAPVQLLGAMDWFKGADIASPAGGILDLTAATGNAVHVTGTNTITAVTLGSGLWRIVIFDGALTLTHHATNNNLPGGANITTAANDRALYWADGTISYCVTYERASGGIITSATQAQQETGTSILVPVTPGVQQFHASAAKGWVQADNSAGAPASYNVTSITDSSGGQFIITWATDFSSANYVVVGTARFDPSLTTATTIVVQAENTAFAAGAITISTLRVSDGARTDVTYTMIAAYGDQ